MLPAFGSGRMYGTRTDTPDTPVEFGLLQGIKLDHSFTTKALYGSSQHAIFIARGEAKLTVSAEVAKISAKQFGSLYFGIDPTAGQFILQTAEQHSIPAITPWQVTIAPPGSGVFASDAGVIYAAGANVGEELTLVSASPTTGQYSVNAATGVYTFATGDASAEVAISYTYTATTGQKIAITQQELGTTPTFKVVLRERDPQTGLYQTVVLNRVASNKLSLATKTSDWGIPSFDMEAMDDGTGNIGTWSFGDNE